MPDDSGVPIDDERPTHDNRAPTIYSDPVTTAEEGVRYRYVVFAEDLDGDVLVFSIPTSPPGMEVDPDTGLITWTPPADSAGSVAVVVRVEDPSEEAAEQAFDIVVAEGSAPPRITSEPELEGAPGARYTYAATAEDPDDTLLTWDVRGPAGMDVAADGTVTWDVPAGDSGLFAVDLTVRDPAGHEDTQTFSIGVAAPGDTTPPTVAITSPEDETLVTAPLEVVGTADDDSLTGYELELCATWMGRFCTLVHSGYEPVDADVLGVIDPRILANGSYELRLTATDAAGNTATVSVLVVLESADTLGVLRLTFEDLVVRTSTHEVVLNRIYDGLDRSPGPLGNGWRYEWSISGHSECPRALYEGWRTVPMGGFPPETRVFANYNHPVSFVLDDGRVFQFDVMLEHQSGSPLGVHPMRPRFDETTSTVSTMRALRADGTAYSEVDYDLTYLEGIVYDTVGVGPRWRPAFFEITTDWEEVLTFDGDTGELVRIEDPSGLVVDNIDGSATLDGRVLVEMEYDDDGYVTSATNVLSGDSVAYERDDIGDLVSVTAFDGTVETYVYGPDSRLIDYSVPGRDPERFEYDARGRVTRHVSSSGAVTETTYDDENHRVIVTDAAGHSVITVYDERGRPTRIIDPLGHSVTITYDGDSGRVATRTDQNGNTWEYEYDDRGRQTVIRDPLGAESTIEFDDRSGRVVVATDAEGRVFRETTDALGRVTSLVLPDGTVGRSFSYPDDSTVVTTNGLGFSETIRVDERGREVSHTDDSGRVRTSTYDDTDHTVAFRDPEGERTATLDRLGRFTTLDLGAPGSFEYTYGPTGHLVNVVRPDHGTVDLPRSSAGQLTGIEVDGEVVEEIRYDALGRVASIRGPAGARSLRYDAAGRVVQATTLEGAIEFEYDAVGHLLRTSTDEGFEQSYEYDEAGRPVTHIDGSGNRHEVTWDASGRITSVSDGARGEVEISYDENGRTSRVVHPSGVSASWTYEPSDQLRGDVPIATMTGLDGVEWSYTHDQFGNVETVTDSDDGVTEYVYSGEGRVTGIIDALDRETSFVWGPGGLTERVSPEGRTEEWAYDATERLTGWTRADGTVINYEYDGDLVRTQVPTGEIWEIERDQTLDRVLDRGAPGGTVVEFHDGRGRTTLLRTGDGGEVEITYATHGLPETIAATTPGGTVFVTDYEHDSDGRIAAVTDPSGGETTFDYDTSGRLIEVVRPNGTSTEMEYGALNRPTAIRHYRGAAMIEEYVYVYDTSGRIEEASTPDGDFEYEYDSLSRLSTERRYEDDVLSEEILRTYDAVGNLLSKTDDSGTTTFTYDDDDRLLNAEGPEGTTRYTYGGRGALIGIEAPDGDTELTYDALDRLVSVTTPTGEVVRYAYDTTGRLLAREDSSGVRRCLPLPATPRGYVDCVLTYGTDDAAEEPRVNVFGAEGLLSTHAEAGARYVWSASLGTVVATTDDDGALVGSWSYDSWGVRSGTSEEDDPGYGFTGERHDAATGLVFLRARHYHPATGRFLTPDLADAAAGDPRTLHRYLYSMADPLNRIDPSGEISLTSLQVGQVIRGILRQIRDQVLRHCIKSRSVRRIYNAVARWAFNAATRQAFNFFKAFIGLPFGYEFSFHHEIAQALCSGGHDGSHIGVPSLFEFEVRVTTCGDYKPMKSRGGWATLRDCTDDIRKNFATHNGIDIVFAGRVPIELKVGSNVGMTQLKTYCRFAAKHGPHVVFYGFVWFPNKQNHDRWANACWRCYKGSSCRGNIGSIYAAFGAMPSKSERVRLYIPDKSVCSPGGIPLKSP